MIRLSMSLAVFAWIMACTAIGGGALGFLIAVSWKTIAGRILRRT